MKKTFFCGVIFISFAFLMGCAASESASEEQNDTLLKNNQKAAAGPHNTGMTNAAKMISPITN